MIRINVDGIEHGFATTSDSVFNELKDKNISFTPTLSAYDHYAPKAVPFMQKTIKRASELNVPIAVGTDYPSSYGENCGDDIFKEMNLLEDIECQGSRYYEGATHYGAEKIGKEKEIGFIGKDIALILFFEGQIDTGRLTLRISGTMYGNMVIEKECWLKNILYFKTKTSMIFPYGFMMLFLKLILGSVLYKFRSFHSDKLYIVMHWSIRTCGQ
jgi:hypothetical protein